MNLKVVFSWSTLKDKIQTCVLPVLQVRIRDNAGPQRRTHCQNQSYTERDRHTSKTQVKAWKSEKQKKTTSSGFIVMQDKCVHAGYN